MTPIQLEYLITVTNTLNMTHAANELHVSQPAISKAIRDLEKEFNITIFDRSKKNLSLTSQGYEFYNYAVKLQKYTDSVHARMLAVGSNLPVVTLGISSTLAPKVLPDLMHRYQAEKDTFSLHIRELNIPDMMRLLNNGLIDIACFAINDNTRLADFHYRTIRPLKVSFCVSNTLIRFQKNTVSVKDIGNVPLILFEAESNQNLFVRNMFKMHDQQPNILYETGQVKTVLSFVSAGIAGSFIDRDFFTDDKHVVCYRCEEYPESNIVLAARQSSCYFNRLLAWLM